MIASSRANGPLFYACGARRLRPTSVGPYKWYVIEWDISGNIIPTHESLFCVCHRSGCHGHESREDAIEHLCQFLYEQAWKTGARSPYEKRRCEVCSAWTNQYTMLSVESVTMKQWYLCDTHMQSDIIHTLTRNWLTLLLTLSEQIPLKEGQGYL